MKKQFIVLASIGVFLFSALALGLTPAFAQSAESIQITPAIVEDNVNPGETYTFSIRVTNTSESEKTLYLLAQDIKGLDAKGLPIFADDGEPTGYELTSWISFPYESVTLAANETRAVPFSVAVPANASPGAHFAGVFFDIRPERLRTTGAGVGIRVASVVNLRIAGDATEEIRLREFSTASYIYSAPPVTFETRAENLGNVLMRPTGVIEITDMLGKKVATVNVNETAAPIFPASDRTHETLWEHDGFTFGKYTAVVSLVYGDDVRKTISAETSFWILPGKLIMTVLGIFFAVMFVLYVIMKMYVRKKLRELGISSARTVTATRQARKYRSSASRLIFVVAAVFMLITAFIVVMFLMFA
jgi:hypothetical protein